jgi:hypothetical protein
MQEQISKLPDGILEDIVEYAISAWAMGSAYAVAKSLRVGTKEDPAPGESFVLAWEKEIDWVADNLQTLTMKGIRDGN